MKNLRKLMGVPYGTVLKYPKSPNAFLTKFTPNQKNKYKQKNRIFSLELGRSLPKRVVWQVSVPFTKTYGILNNSLNSTALSVFRSVFFGKMWLLNNASVVPGVVWPTKSQKSLIAKMKAFKALSLHLGGLKTGVLIKNLQKIYALSFSSPHESSIWKMASTLDSLKGSFFVKLGYFLQMPRVKNTVQYKMFHYQGFNYRNFTRFIYPGDFHSFPKEEKAKLFAQIFSVGPQSSNQALYANQPFLWLSSSFFSPQGIIPKKKTERFSNILF